MKQIRVSESNWEWLMAAKLKTRRASVDEVISDLRNATPMTVLSKRRAA